VLVDTPGLDAYGHQEHEELTLRQFLPLADIVVVMTSIRNPFKAADLKLINALLENDQRALFVLSQIDLEVDSYEGGRLWKSREAKLASHHQRLLDDLSGFPRLWAEGVVLVSGKQAREARGDRTAESWGRSNFEAVLGRLVGLSRELHHLLV